MIDQLKGIVEQKTLTYAVLFVNDVGYKLTMSINGLDSLPSKGKEAPKMVKIILIAISALALIGAILTVVFWGKIFP